MKKKRTSFYYAMIMLFCQISLCIFGALNVSAADETETKTSTETNTTPSLTSKQKYDIIKSCDTIRENLKTLQVEDSYVRTYLGDRYDRVLNNFITPFNQRLLSNNFAETDSQSQSALSSAKETFSSDYIYYQKTLESVINSSNCEIKPEIYYQEIISLRGLREAVSQDVMRIETIISNHVIFVNNLKETFND